MIPRGLEKDNLLQAAKPIDKEGVPLGVNRITTISFSAGSHTLSLPKTSSKGSLYGCDGPICGSVSV